MQDCNDSTFKLLMVVFELYVDMAWLLESLQFVHILVKYGSNFLFDGLQRVAKDCKGLQRIVKSAIHETETASQ